MGARIHIRVTGVDEAGKADTLRRLDAVLTAAGYPRVKAPPPPKPARHLRAVAASGEHR